MTLLFDIETTEIGPNGEMPDKVHCIVVSDDVGEQKVYHDDPSLKRSGTLFEGAQRLSTHSGHIVAHNLLGFDLLVLNKLFPQLTFERIHDTFLLSQMFYANEMQRHSIYEWGTRVNAMKPDHEDWTKLSEDMIKRCKVDVEILRRIWVKYLEPYAQREAYQPAIQLEYDVMKVFNKTDGWMNVDRSLIERGISRLTRYKDLLQRQLIKNFKPVVAATGEITKPLKKDGAPNTRVVGWAESVGVDPATIRGPYTKFDTHEINLNSSKQVTSQLLSLGWKPDSFTPAGSPKISDSRFHGLCGSIKKYLEKYNSIKTRLGVLTSWHNKSETGRIQGRHKTCGTNTGRWRHGVIANVPKVSVFMGELMRKVFVAEPGHYLVGCDAAQLEARLIGHYTYNFDGGKYADFLLNEDVHTFNANLWGVDRGIAKGGGFAIEFGCFPKKLSLILGCSVKDAKKHWDAYWDARPACKKLKKVLTDVVDKRSGGVDDLAISRAYIKGLDGRPLYVRAKHKLVNTLIQAAGAILMKKAYVLLDKKLEPLGANILILYHDEFVIQVPDNVDPQIVRDLAEQSIVDAGKHFNLNIDMAAESAAGQNWAEIH